MPSRKIIIDQDALGPASTNLQAIAMLLNAPDVEALGICVPTGDHWRDLQVRHALRLLEIMERTEIPVLPGALAPLVHTPRDHALWEKQHGRLIYNGAWDLTRPGRTIDPHAAPDLPEGNPTTAPADEHAANFIIRQARAHPGEISLWCAGPLTNIAAAIETEPDMATAMASLVIMGGTVAVPGNVTPAAEFNIWMDPEAADIVFRSGAPITMVGLDVCHQTSFDRDRAARLRRNGSPLAEFVAGAAEAWIDVREQLFPEHEALHLYDTLAVAAAIEPDLLDTRPALVEIETSDGPAQGMTVTYQNDILRQFLTDRDPNAEVAVGVDSARFAKYFNERVAGRL